MSDISNSLSENVLQTYFIRKKLLMFSFSALYQHALMTILFSNCFIFASLSCKKSGQTVWLPTGRSFAIGCSWTTDSLLYLTNSTANFFYLHNLLDTAVEERLRYAIPFLSSHSKDFSLKEWLQINNPNYTKLLTLPPFGFSSNTIFILFHWASVKSLW